LLSHVLGEQAAKLTDEEVEPWLTSFTLYAMAGCVAVPEYKVDGASIVIFPSGVPTVLPE
jgi:hypothetical protein